jgi:hypothetical protein
MDSSKPDEHRDPLTGEPGAHPVGVGVGTAVGGAAGGAAAGAAAAATGAALGSAVGPVGTAVGVVAGGVVGALVGRTLSEAVNPAEEDAYWRQNYASRPYVEEGVPYGDYQQAYEYGWATRGRYPGRRFEDAEAELRGGWEQARAKLPWDKARLAVRDAWDRIDLWHANAPDAGDAPAEERRPL